MSVGDALAAAGVGLAALVPMLTVFLLLQATRWDRQAETLPPALLLALSVGLGIGLSSCSYFLALALFGGGRGGAIAIDTVLLTAAAAAAWRVGALRPPATRRRDERASGWLLAAVLFSGCAAGATFLLNAAGKPHGEWDAWAVWNLRARWLFRAGPEWASAFTESTVHGDYPILLPAAVARLWAYAGDDSPLAPRTLAAAYAGALVLLLYGATSALRGRAQGLLAALCLLGTPVFLRSIAWQYADVPLAFAMLATLALIALRDHDAACGASVLVWAGFAAGLAAWTKNEGLLFLLCVALVRGATAVAARKSPQAVGWFAAGLLPPAAAVAGFKVALAPGAYYLAGQDPAQFVARVLDIGRYGVIAAAAWRAALRNAGGVSIALVLYVAMLGRTGDPEARRAARGAALVLALVALGYAVVYLTTPADLEWQLGHSIDRLALQLWPSALFAFWIYAASPAEVAATAAPRGRRRKQARKRG